VARVGNAAGGGVPVVARIASGVHQLLDYLRTGRDIRVAKPRSMMSSPARRALSFKALT